MGVKFERDMQGIFASKILMQKEMSFLKYIPQNELLSFYALKNEL
jgi:hypothetical protein